MLLSEAGAEFQVDENYRVQLPNTENMVVIAGANFPQAGTRFTSPNVAGIQDKVFYTRAYWPDGRKKWFDHAGRDFFFVIPSNRIELLEEKGYSYVPVKIGDKSYRFSVSGGTNGNGWTDYVRQNVHIGIGCTKKSLAKLAEFALPAWEVSISLPTPNEENEERDRLHFMRLIAKQVGRKNLAEGHKIHLDGTTVDGTSVLVVDCFPQNTRKQYCLGRVGNSQGVTQVPYSLIDWLKTCELNEWHVAKPTRQNYSHWQRLS